MSNNIEKDNPPAPEYLSITQILRILWRRKVILASAVGLLAGVALAITLATEPTYRVRATLVPVQTTASAGILGSFLGRLGDLSSIAGLGLPTQEDTAEALTLFESRQLLQKFIHEKELLPKLFPDAWNAKAGQWKSSARPPPTLWKGYSQFRERFRAFRDRKSGMVAVELDWPDRNEAATLTNELVARVNDHMRERAIKEAQLTIEYLEQELQKSGSVEVRSAIYAMIENQIKLKSVAAVRKQFAFRTLDPALAPDKDELLRPKPLLYVGGGAAVGLLLGILFGLIFDARATRRQLKG